MILPTMNQAKAQYFQQKLDGAKKAATYSKENPAIEDLTDKYERDVIKFTGLVEMYS
tara:strand:+ start:1170 stop:1340 length:171 start_codon:yes stop_codon:yes gene_type:complete